MLCSYLLPVVLSKLLLYSPEMWGVVSGVSPFYGGDGRVKVRILLEP